MARRIKSHPAGATFPAPRFHTVQDKGKQQNCVKFFEYWRDIGGSTEKPSDKADLIEVRFYLHWPVIDQKLVDPSRQDTVFDLITGPLWFENPEDYLDEMPKRFGSGDWHVCLNEIGVHGEIMEAYFSAVNLDKYPPKIDLRTLVRGTAKNESYIKWLGVNNIRTPWGNPEEQEDDMANTDALRVVAETLQRTTETAVSATQEAAEARVAAAEAGAERAAEISENRATHETNAVKESIELVTTTAKEMVQMVSRNAGGQFNPIEMMRAAKEMMTPQTEDGSIKLLVEAVKDGNARLVEMQTKQFEFIQTVIKRERAEVVATSNAAPAGPFAAIDAFLEAGEKFDRLAERFGGKRFGSQNDAPPPPPAKGLMESISENIVPVCTMITTGMTILGTMLYNWKLKPGEAPMNPQEAVVKAQQSNPALQYQAAQAQPPAQDPRVSWKGFIDQIAKKMQTHFYEADLDGHTFAEWILTNDTGGTMHTPEGRRIYVKVKEQLGRAQFDQLVREHPTLWPMFQGMEQKYKIFLDEFFGYDEWEAQQQAEEAVTA